MTQLPAARVVTPDGVIGPAVVELDGGVIAAISPTTGPTPGRTLVPGFVDLQVNGHDDVDVATAAGDDWDRIDRLLGAQGVTTWCPTLVTAPLDRFGAALERIASAAERPGPRPAIAGAHLEGPFLGGRPGAHPPELLRALDTEWLAALPPVVRLVTLAPELDGAPDAVRMLRARDVVVSLGHTAADLAQIDAAVGAGATLVTHLFNGMPPLHHREPGMVGAALTDDRLAVCLIPDLVHVHPRALALTFRAKPPGRIVLVTDAIAWRGARIAGRTVHHDGRAPRLEDGTLAGSSLTMDRGVANLVGAAGVPLADAVRAAATTPADVLGLADRGRLAPGYRADVVALGPDLRVEATWIGGDQVLG